MGFENFNAGIPADNSENENQKLPNADDLPENFNAVDLPEAERNEISQERHSQEDGSFRDLEQKALTSMAGGPKLTFREKQEVIAGWNARLDEEERKDLIERLNAVR